MDSSSDRLGDSGDFLVRNPGILSPFFAVVPERESNLRPRSPSNPASARSRAGFCGSGLGKSLV